VLTDARLVLVAGFFQGGHMVSDILKGKWHQLKGSIKERWGELTDDEVDEVEGKVQQLVGLLQEKYGYTKEKAETEVADFLNEYS
jgi:uncharacterized protein YjbJ (UPF0337 family)